MLKLWKSAPSSHEDLFLERYQRLLAWSLKLTANDRQLAEDLLHDTFVQFTFNRPELEAIRDVDSYLYAMLRNSHVSHLRRALHVRTTSLSMVEFDSLEVGLRVADVQDQIKVQDELRLICHYATLRKETSKAGSVLLLRFFHGYYPSEIAHVLRSNWVAVTKWLQRARAEAALYLENPQSLSFVKAGPPQSPPSLGFARSTQELLADLRRMISAAKQGCCLSVTNLRELYGGTETPIEHEALAHLVSCAKCLDAVNRLLGLPLLSERFPTDMTGRDKKRGGPGDSPPPSAAKDDQALRSLRRVKETFEHRPKELRIAINGFVQASQKISSDRMEQTLSLDLEEKPDFVEVFSEQWIRMLFLDVEPPLSGAFAQCRRIQLSNGRSLAAIINFSGPCPDLHVIYEDPTLNAVESAIPNSESDIDEWFDTPALTEDFDSHHIDKQIAGSPIRKLGLSANLRKHWPGVIRRIPRNLSWRPFFRPGPVTALLATVFIAAALLYLRSASTNITARELLQRSSAAEEDVSARPSQVVHRSINLEERLVAVDAASVSRADASLKVLSRRRLELWQNGVQQAALRVYDEQNQLVNGAWQNGASVRVLLHHGSKLQTAPAKNLAATKIAFSDVWQLVPSSATFSQLIEPGNQGTVSESAPEYTLTYHIESTNGLLGATLVLNRPDLRAIRETLIVKEGGELREYLFRESSFEQRPLSAVPPAVFEPDAELLSAEKPEVANSKSGVSPLQPSALASLPVVASPELEVEVLRRLNRVSAFLGEQIAVQRTPEGQLSVKGIVENDERKDQLLQALASLKANPALKLEINTVAEALQRQRQIATRPMTVTRVESNKTEILLDSEVRQYLAKTGIAPDQLNQEVQRFSARLLNHSFQARRHALAMKQIAERFSLDDLRTLEPQAKANWRAMLAEHAQALRQETASLRRELQGAFSPLAGGDDGAIDVASDEVLVRAVQQLFALAVSNDDSIHRSFAIYTGQQGVAPVKTPEFWRSLRGAENMAAAIAK